LRAVTGLDARLLHIPSLAAVWLTFTFPLMRAWVFREVNPGRCRAHRATATSVWSRFDCS
jgi:hypothetical protein